MADTVFCAEKTRSFLSEDIQNLLMYWRDKFCQGYFEIGDIAAAIVNEWTDGGIDFVQQEIFNEIGRFCGKSGRTIRYYYETAVFYPHDLRDRYASLPFSHFVFARSFGDWQSVLDFALEHPTHSEEQLRREFIGVPPCISDLVPGEHEEGEGVQSDYQANAPDPVANNKYRYYKAVSSMREGVCMIRELLDDMDEDERRSYSDLLYVLEPAIEHLPKLIEKL